MTDKATEFQINWDGRIIRLSYVPNYFSDVAHLEIRSEDGFPLPITETGYKSHFIMVDNPPDKNEVIGFVTDWLNEEAKSKAWLAYVAQSRQLELF